MLTEVNSIHFGAYFGAARLHFWFGGFLVGGAVGRVLYNFPICFVPYCLILFSREIFAFADWHELYIFILRSIWSAALLFLHHRLDKVDNNVWPCDHNINTNGTTSLYFKGIFFFIFLQILLLLTLRLVDFDSATSTNGSHVNWLLLCSYSFPSLHPTE